MSARALTYSFAAVSAAAGVACAIASLAVNSGSWDSWGPNIAVTLMGTALTVAVINGVLEIRSGEEARLTQAMEHAAAAELETQRNRAAFRAEVITALQDFGQFATLFRRDFGLEEDRIETFMSVVPVSDELWRTPPGGTIWGTEHVEFTLTHYYEFDLHRPVPHAPSLGLWHEVLQKEVEELRRKLVRTVVTHSYETHCGATDSELRSVWELSRALSDMLRLLTGPQGGRSKSERSHSGAGLREHLRSVFSLAWDAELQSPVAM